MALFVLGDEFNPYDIASVEPYYPGPKPWSQTTAGILTIFFACLALLIVLAIVIAVLYWKCWRDQKRHVVKD